MVSDLGAAGMRIAEQKDIESVYALVQSCIKAVYPLCYEPAVVSAFSRYHSRESVASDIESGKVRLLEADGTLLATGTLDGEFITRVYVQPGLRGQGLGTRVMDALEDEAARGADHVFVDSSAPAERFYQGRGYQVTTCEEWHIDAYGDLPATVLVYKVMRKGLGDV